MDAAHATEWGGPRHRHHRPHRQRHWGDWLAMMQSRHGGFDPRVFGFVYGPGGRRGWGGRGPKARRGDVRAALLLLLEEQPRNGYQLIQEIERRTDGFWKPSPGSIYPALQQLEDEGLVRAQQADSRRSYTLTDEGRAYVEDNREELGDPLAAATGGIDEDVMDLRGLLGQVAAAVMQVIAAGHATEARRILTDTRRALYKVLAEDETETREA